MSFTISLDEIIIAYRKAKADAFFDNGHLTSLMFADYEQQLLPNLRDFEKKINEEDYSWVENKEFVGTHTAILKKTKVDRHSGATENNPVTFYSSSHRNWEDVKEVKADFRIIGKHTVEFHLLSSLWIEKVGMLLEERMSPNCYGCRLKISPNKSDTSIPDFIYNTVERKERSYVGHFRPYMRSYQEWQYKGLKKIKDSITEGRKVLAVTADFAKYYHRIDCSFIETEEFKNDLDVHYSPIQEKLNALLVKAITMWSTQVYNDENVPYVFKYKGHCGVPMGLGASKVIANILLTFFDKRIETEIKPLYYGRYVDDIFLVLEDGSSIATPIEFWNFLDKRIDEIHLKTKTNKKIDVEDSQREYKPKTHILKVPYSEKSLLEFSEGKEKYFFLEGESGEAFSRTVKETLDQNSSEWKLPPNTEEDIEGFSEAMTEATSSTTEPANGLRKSDGLSIQKMKFILFLTRFETAIELLPQKCWEKPLDVFFKIVTEYTITADNISIYSRYYPRVISLAVKAKHKKAIREIFNSVNKAYDILRKVCVINDDYPELEQLQYCIDKAAEYERELMIEGIYSSIDPSPKSTKQIKDIIDSSIGSSESFFDYLADSARKLFYSDLHKVAFKDAFLATKDDGKFKENVFNSFDEFELAMVETPGYQDFITLVDCLFSSIDFKNSDKRKNPKALFFYTRPFTVLELTVLIPQWFKFKHEFVSICRFYHHSWEPPILTDQVKLKRYDNFEIVSLRSPNNTRNRTFALTSLETKHESWDALVRDDGFDPDVERTQRILDLTRSILKCKKDIHYVLFPEVSIPRKLLIYLSNRFASKSISIIAGFEYEEVVTDDAILPSGKGFVSNQLVYVLCMPNEFGLHQVLLKQEKIIPALEEERQLFEVGGKYLKAVHQEKLLINHGNFWFSGLICNDFLNIDNRAALRGIIDALFIIEWNKDVNTYNALVEASANDIHTFVFQVNNRLYGDTRLRAPYKEDFKRDQVRVRGGELDYFVVTTINIDELRKFQSHYRSPDKPFKPVPTGFEISPDRKYSPQDKKT